MKKLILLSAVVLLVCLCAVSVSAADVKLGDVYSTDILATVDGHPIPSYNIGGYTCICMEDLQYYGFKVVWNAEERTITANASTLTPDYAHYAKTARGTGGKIVGAYYQTNIVAYVNGYTVESYNIGGYTCVCIETLGDLDGSSNAQYGYSTYCMKASWDAKNKIIALSTLLVTPERDIMNALDGYEYGIYYTRGDAFGTFTVSMDKYQKDFRGVISKMMPIYLATRAGATDILLGYATPQGAYIDIAALKAVMTDDSNVSKDPFMLAKEAMDEDDFETLKYFDLDDTVLLYGRYYYSRDDISYSLRLFLPDGTTIEYMDDLPNIDAADPILPAEDLKVNGIMTEATFSCKWMNKTYRYCIDLITGEIELDW